MLIAKILTGLLWIQAAFNGGMAYSPMAYSPEAYGSFTADGRPVIHRLLDYDYDAGSMRRMLGGVSNCIEFDRTAEPSSYTAVSTPTDLTYSYPCRNTSPVLHRDPAAPLNANITAYIEPTWQRSNTVRVNSCAANVSVGRDTNRNLRLTCQEPT